MSYQRKTENQLPAGVVHPLLLDINATAVVLGVSASHVRRLRELGKLPSTKSEGKVLWKWEAVQAYVDSI